MSDLPFDYAETMRSLRVEYEKTRADIVTMQEGLAGASASVRAKSRQVSATVDARGRLTELRFHGQAYRTMAPPELARLVLETVNRAHEKAQREMWTSAAGFLPSGVTVDDVVGGDVNWASAIAEELRLPAFVQDLLDRTGRGLPVDEPRQSG